MTPLLLALAIAASVPDTLSASMVRGDRDLPVVRPAEDVRLSEVSNAPAQVADVLRRFTGVQVKDYGGVGGLKTVNVRSLGSEHIGIFIDGIQIDNAQNMQVDLGRFSTDGLSAVALYNSQKSVRLQTAKEYAAGAGVYLTSAAPVTDGLKLRLRGGSFGTVNPSAEWTKLMGTIALRASADFLASNGKYKFPYFDTTLVRQNGDISALRLQTQLYGREWQITLYAYGSERGFPGPVIRRASGFPFSAERQADQDLFVQGSWTHDWTSRYSTALRLKYANNYTHYSTHPEKNPMALPYDLHYRQQSAYLSVAQSVSIFDWWSVDLSTDVQGNTLSGQPSNPRRLAFTGALATRLMAGGMRIAAHIAYLGAYDMFASPSPGGWLQEDAWRDAWMPSASIAWSPLAWLEASAFARRSFRLPSFNDLYYTLIGNSNLEPESASQFGFDLRLHGDGPQTWEVRVSPYYNRVDDKIVAIPTSSQFRWTMLNIGVADVTGLDLKASGAWQSGDWSFGTTCRYSFQQALDHSTPDSQTYGNQIPYIPLHSGSLDLTAKWRSLSVGFAGTFTSERWSRSANTSDYHIDPWSTCDFTAGYNFKRFTLSVRCNNIFGTRYQIVQGYPMPGRNILAGMEFCF